MTKFKDLKGPLLEWRLDDNGEWYSKNIRNNKILDELDKTMEKASEDDKEFFRINEKVSKMA